MKSVGQQLKEARLAKNWTPELAARETKIKADRVRDLESDDYTNFSSPTYARGFVRTYARALGLDEYRILRQLDNKLPEDDNASFAQDNGSMPYVPEPSTQKMHVSSAPRTGLYVVFGMGVAVVAVIAFVMLQAYRAGELQRYFASTAPSDSASLNSGASAPVADSDAPPHAVAVDPNDTSHSPRALPVDLNALASSPAPASATKPATPAATGSTNATPALAVSPAPVAPTSTDATPVPSSSSSPVVVPAAGPTPSGSPSSAPAIAATDSSAPVTTPADPAPAPSPADPSSTPAPTANTSDTTASSGDKPPPRALPVDPRDLVAANQASPEGPIDPSSQAPPTIATTAPIPSALNSTPNLAAIPVAAPVNARSPKALILTASHDSTVRVTSLDSSGRQVLYDSVLRKGQSLEFDGRRFSVDVGVPSAVEIMLDGVYYGPHSEGATPETFTVESHHP